MMNPIQTVREEWRSACAGLGAEVPLLVGMILAGGLDSASVLIVFGLAQIASSLHYGSPMAVQPLPLVAILVISQRLGGELLAGGGLAIGLLMLLLVRSRLLDRLARVVPRPVVRGMQFGLGLQLAALAFREYIQAEQALGLGLAAVTLLFLILAKHRPQVPAALVVILVGAVYAWVIKLGGPGPGGGFSLRLPHPYLPGPGDLWTGFLLLALPQIPLSVTHSCLATAQVSKEWFPERGTDCRKLGATESILNLVSSLLGGIPVGHSANGLSALRAEGAKSGGALLLSGSGYLVLGLFWSAGFARLVRGFPLPILGVLLLFEALEFLLLSRDQAEGKLDFRLVLLVGLLASSLPYGYLVGLVAGTTIHYLVRTDA